MLWRSKVKLNELGGTEEEIRDQIRKYLKRSGAGDTKKARTIMYFAQKHGGHFTFSEAYQASNKNIITSDVDKLVKAGFLKSICRIGNNGKHTHLYESTIGTKKPQHSHLLCTKCDGLVEFDDTLLRELADKVCDHFEFERHFLNVQIDGRCKDCIGK